MCNHALNSCDCDLKFTQAQVVNEARRLREMEEELLRFHGTAEGVRGALLAHGTHERALAYARENLK